MAYSENLQATVRLYDSIGSAYQVHVGSKARQGYDETTLASLLGDLSGKTVLDVGSGTGRWSRLALRHGASNVYALEPSAGMDAVAVDMEKELHLQNVQHLRGDICGCDLASVSVDVAIIGYVVQHLSSRQQVLQGLKNVYNSLKAGGLLVGANICLDASANSSMSSGQWRAVLSEGNHEWYRGECWCLDPEMQFFYFVQRWETIRELLQEAGFRCIQRAKIKYSDELLTSISAMTNGDELMREYEKHIAYFSATK